jgi:hypothetical protein
MPLAHDCLSFVKVHERQIDYIALRGIPIYPRHCVQRRQHQRCLWAAHWPLPLIGYDTRGTMSELREMAPWACSIRRCISLATRDAPIAAMPSNGRGFGSAISSGETPFGQGGRVPNANRFWGGISAGESCGLFFFGLFLSLS